MKRAKRWTYIFIPAYILLIVLIVYAFAHPRAFPAGQKKAGSAYAVAVPESFVDEFSVDIIDNAGIAQAEGVVWDGESSIHPTVSAGMFVSESLPVQGMFSSVSAEYSARGEGIIVEISTDNGMTWCKIAPGDTLIDCVLPARFLKYRVILTESTAIDAISLRWRERGDDEQIPVMAKTAESLPIITLLRPANGAVVNVSAVEFACSVEDESGLAFVSLYYSSSQEEWHKNMTKSINGTVANESFALILPADNYTWSCEGVNLLGNASFGENWTFQRRVSGVPGNASNETHNTTPEHVPAVILISPVDRTVFNRTNVTVVCTASDSEGLQKVSLFYSSRTISWGAKENRSVSGNATGVSFNMTLVDASYVWNCRAEDRYGHQAFANANWSFSTSQSCSPDWSCTPWDSTFCGERQCVDNNKCGTSFGKPLEVKACPDDGPHEIAPWVDLGKKKGDVCTDGRDNEGFPPTENGCIDEKDVACGGKEAACWGKIDDDCDGMIDCEDPDCIADDNCLVRSVRVGQQEQTLYRIDEVVSSFPIAEEPKETNSSSSSFEEVQGAFSFMNWVMVGLLAGLFLSLLFLAYANRRQPVHSPELLSAYILKKIQEGVPPEKIKEALRKHGWIDEIIEHEFRKLENDAEKVAK